MRRAAVDTHPKHGVRLAAAWHPASARPASRNVFVRQATTLRTNADTMSRVNPLKKMLTATSVPIAHVELAGKPRAMSRARPAPILSLSRRHLAVP